MPAQPLPPFAPALSICRYSRVGEFQGLTQQADLGLDGQQVEGDLHHRIGAEGYGPDPLFHQELGELCKIARRLPAQSTVALIPSGASDGRC